MQAEDAEAGDGARRLLERFLLERPLPVRPRYTYAYVTADSAGRAENRLYRDCIGIGSGTWEQLHLRLLTDMNRNAVEQYRGLAAHAGVVGADGRAIALPADSSGGKSTLTAAAVMTGFDYASDESLCFAPDSGVVIPYPKPITLSRESVDLLGITDPRNESDLTEIALTPDQIGGGTSTGVLELTDVVFHEYGHAETSLTPLPASEIVAGLLRLSFNHYKNPAEAFRLVTTIARSARAWRLTYGTPKEGAELLWEELGARAR